MLVVDQAEEAVTLCEDAEERAAYFRALGEHGGPVVVALRADRMGDLSAYPEFAALAERGLHLLTAMKEEDLREAVQGPARAVGLRLEGGLVDLLVREVLGEPGALPLLSHVLRQTWERREGGTLTVAGYRSTGGIRHAVAPSAESLYDAMGRRSARAQLRGLMLRTGLGRRRRRPGPHPTAARQSRRGRRPLGADGGAGQPPGWSPSTGTPSRSRTRRSPASGPGCAAGSTTTSSGSGCSVTSPAPPTPGTPSAGRTASSTAACA